MKVAIYFVFIFFAILKNADAQQGPISHMSREAVYNIVIKPDLIIEDRTTHFTYHDIVLEYQNLCDIELERAHNEVVVRDVEMICNMSLQTLSELKTPDKIANYERHIKSRVHNYNPIPDSICNNENSNMCKVSNQAADITDNGLRLIFYPIRALMTGQFDF